MTSLSTLKGPLARTAKQLRPVHRERRTRPWHLYLLTALGVALFALALTQMGPPASAARTSTQVVSAQKGVVQSTVTGTGNIEPGTDENVNFQTSGTLSAVDLRVGQHVNNGQLLATLGSANAQLALDQAESELTAAEDQLSSVESGSTTSTSSGNGGASAGASGSSTTTSSASSIAAAQAGSTALRRASTPLAQRLTRPGCTPRSAARSRRSLASLQATASRPGAPAAHLRAPAERHPPARRGQPPAARRAALPEGWEPRRRVPHPPRAAARPSRRSSTRAR